MSGREIQEDIKRRMREVEPRKPATDPMTGAEIKCPHRCTCCTSPEQGKRR
jgi:hypothetical protein